MPPAARKLRRFLDARAENCQRAAQRPYSRAAKLGALVWNLRVAALIGHDALPVPKQAAPRAGQHFFHHRLGLERIPETIVIDDAGNVSPWGEHGLERPFDRPLERPPVDLVLHARRE